MNIGKLKEAIAGYLGKSSATFVLSTGATQVDLLLKALNQARKRAERYHNFLCSQVYAQISVVPTTGGSLDNAVLASDGVTAVDVHTVQTWYLDVEDDDLPIKAIDKKTIGMLSKRRNYANRGTLDERYPSDASAILSPLDNTLPYVYMEGRTVKLHPEQDETKTLRMDAFKWMADYTANTDEDWFCKVGEDYLMWAGIVECNYLTGTFVQNREGTLSPPQKLADTALEELIEHDKWLKNESHTPEYR